MNPQEKSEVRSQGSGVRSQGSGIRVKESAAGTLGNGSRITGPFQNEPLTDFSREDARRMMQEALDEVKRQLGRLYPLVIDGKAVKTEATLDSLNPSHMQQVVGKCAKASVVQAEQA